jgi:hypothetical protein
MRSINVAKCSAHRFCLRDYDFRNGEKMFFVDHEKHLPLISVRNLLTSRPNMSLMTRMLGFYLAVATKAV